jgi:hypothetical protein
MCIPEQVNRTGEKIVEVLYGNVNGPRLIHRYRYHLAVRIRVLTDGGQEVAHPALCRKVAVAKAKALYIIRVAWISEILQRCAPLPAVDKLPTDQ